MKVERKTLTRLNACSDGLIWFDKQEDKDLSSLVKTAIKEGGDSLNYAGWGLCAVMTKSQRLEWAIYCSYQVAHLWKDKSPKEYAIWDTWASGRDRSTAASSAARAATWDATSAAARAAARAATSAAACTATSAAARAATWDAARAAASAAARDATGSAARDATWDAARAAASAAAWAAARDATGSAARDAASAAARAAARDKMLSKLIRKGVAIVYSGKGNDGEGKL